MAASTRRRKRALRLALAGALALAGCAGGGDDIQGPGPGDTNDPPARGIPQDDDPTAAGLPALKRSHTEGLALVQGDPDHFDFTATDHWVRTTTLHGTQLDVAIANTAVLTGGPTRDAFADLIFAAFHEAWHVFGGFPYDRYAVRVRPADGRPFSLSPVGITIADTDYRAPSVYEFTVHEMFHSWNGGTVRPAPDGNGNLFQWETWFVEGATVYYSFRLLGATRAESDFRNGMEGRRAQYEARRGTAADLPIDGLVAAIGAAEPNDPAVDDFVRMLYARGALVAWLLDRELTARGANLDEVLQRMYASGLAGQTWSRASLAADLAAVGGTGLDALLETWLDTDQPLPLTAAFTLLR